MEPPIGNKAMISTIIDSIVQIVISAWDVLLDSSPYIIFGFLVAGLLKAFIPNDLVQRHLGEGRISSIFKASLLGIPIPLCSCGVLPAAAGIREQGAGKGAVSSFMISTPETGVDSIAITYALLDPLMTVFRPVAAFFTAVTTGLAVHVTDRERKTPKPSLTPLQTLPTNTCSCEDDCCAVPEAKQKASIKTRIQSGMRFSFGDLLEDIGSWLLIGVLLAGMIEVVLSPELIDAYLGNEIVSMLLMVAVATPLYVCATASTPIAAALVLKGLSPGAALVFLMAGPATNVATITVVARVIGKKAAAIYVASILICSLAMGWVVNLIYRMSGLDIQTWITGNTTESHGIIAYGSTLVLLLLIGRGFKNRVTDWGLRLKNRFRSTTENIHLR